MPAMLSSQGLLNSHCHLRPCRRTCSFVKHTRGTRHSKQRLSIPVSVREGEPQEVSVLLPLFA